MSSEGSGVLPIIDVQSLSEAQDANHEAVKTLRQACTDIGFFLAKYDVSGMDEAFEVSNAFFDLPEDVKRSCKGTMENNWRGYGPYGNGQNCSPNVKKPDRKETFYYGAPQAGQSTPTVQEIPEFDKVLSRFHASMLRVTRILLRGLSLSLNLPADTFERIAYQNPVAKVLMTSYPPVQEGDEVSCGSHTDCGFLTILCAEGGSGLQVQRLDGTWLAVESSRDYFVCNIGDLAARWTNDVLRSTPHRVLNESGKVRRSLIFFNNMDEDAVVECLPSCVSDEQPAKYEKTTAGRYVAVRLGFMRDNYEGESEYKCDDIAEPDKADVKATVLPEQIAS
jgi:isopenicillin N synthase-like dioxygenase